MRYLSVCSGIEAASTAWHPLGWTPVAFSEIEPAPCKVLAHHYPNVPNWGDMTKFKEWPDAEIDLLVGGTPCQSFSVAGLRKGLDDPRGNLMLTYLAIADKYKPKYIAWENVPGVLSSNGGRDFGTFLGALGKLGYGYAYRVLDAQYVRTDGYPNAVPQRRRRVFVVGCLGDWGRAAAILFDSESVCGNPPPRREAGKGVAADVARSTFPCGGIGSYLSGDVSSPLLRTGADLGPGCETLVGQGVTIHGTHPSVQKVASYDDVAQCMRARAPGYLDNSSTTVVMSHGQANAEISVGFAPTLNCNHEQPIAFTARCDGADARVEATPTMRSLCCGADRHQSGAAGLSVAYGLPGNWIGRSPENGGNAVEPMHNVAPCQTKSDVHAVAFSAGNSAEARSIGLSEEHTPPLRAGASGTNMTPAVMTAAMQVRRLTPRECERLQGFPDGHTAIPGMSDTARYKMLGNSMAVNVMQLIGERIARYS